MSLSSSGVRAVSPHASAARMGGFRSRHQGSSCALLGSRTGRRVSREERREELRGLKKLMCAAAVEAGWIGLELCGEPSLVASRGHVFEVLERWAEHFALHRTFEPFHYQLEDGVLFARLQGEGGCASWLGLVGIDRRGLVHQERHDLSEQIYRFLAWRLGQVDALPRARTSAGEERRRRFPEDFLPRKLVAGTSPAMRALYADLEVASGTDAPVLLLGETGVGKEHLARLVHDASRRAGGRFVAINCAALPSELLEAELFGIGDGVASGVRKRPGIFQQAEGGTLLLDEIGEMSASLQAKLLRALQEKEVRPVGGAPRRIDTRIVAATNVDIERCLEDGSLRADLYYRLTGHLVRVPPLRERRPDILALVEHFLAAHGGAACGIALPALRRLVAYDWPGNVRQLEHEVRRLALSCRGESAIGVDALSAALRAESVELGTKPGNSKSSALKPPTGSAEGLHLETRVGDLERELIQRALQQGGSISEAARLLGISRNGLKQKCRRLSISPRRE